MWIWLINEKLFSVYSERGFFIFKEFENFKEQLKLKLKKAENTMCIGLLRWCLQPRRFGGTRGYFFSRISFNIPGLSTIFLMNFLLFIRLINFSRKIASSLLRVSVCSTSSQSSVFPVNAFL